MVSLFGRGFDSRQLHNKKNPYKGKWTEIDWILVKIISISYGYLSFIWGKRFYKNKRPTDLSNESQFPHICTIYLNKLLIAEATHGSFILSQKISYLNFLNTFPLKLCIGGGCSNKILLPGAGLWCKVSATMLNLFFISKESFTALGKNFVCAEATLFTRITINTIIDTLFMYCIITETRDKCI